MECYKSKLYDFENDIFSPEKYMKLDDSLLDEVRCSDDESLVEAQKIIERIDFRKHYKCVGEKGLNEKDANEIYSKLSVDNILAYQKDSDENLL